MEQVICGASAFELYRIPPQVTLLLPEFPRFSTRRQRSAISRSNDLGPWLNLPIHTLCDSPSARTRSSAIKDHVWSGASRVQLSGKTTKSVFSTPRRS